MILPSSPDRLAQVQEALRHEFVPERPPVVNDRAVASLTLGDSFELPEGSGFWYTVPPVDYLKGARLERLALEIQDVRRGMKGAANPREVLDRKTELQGKAMDELARMVRPVNWFRRLLWPIVRRYANPFRLCTDREVASLLLFFCSLTMKSRIRFSVTSGSSGR